MEDMDMGIDMGMLMDINDGIDQEPITIIAFSMDDMIADYEEWMEAIATSPR